MSDFIVPNIICFQTQKQFNTLNNIGILLKGVLIDLCACNFVHVKTYLRARCVHTRHRARNLSSRDVKRHTKILNHLLTQEQWAKYILSMCIGSLNHFI